MTSKAGVAFTVTLSAAGAITVSISRSGHTIGVSTVHLPAGESTVTIKRSGGHALTRGHDSAKLRLEGSTVVHYSASFTVTHERTAGCMRRRCTDHAAHAPRC